MQDHGPFTDTSAGDQVDRQLVEQAQNGNREASGRLLPDGRAVGGHAETGPRAAEPLANTRVEIIVTGGKLRPETLALVGPITGGTLSDLHFDKLFLGTNGIDLERGVTPLNLAEADAKRAMIRSARETIVVADSSKFGRAAFARICGVERLHGLITDEGAPAPVREAISRLGVRVIVAPPRGPR